MEYEVIVKYNGDISFLEQELGVTVELLGYNYAIITADTPEKVNSLLNYTQIEYVEKPFILDTQDTQSFSSTGITEFKERTNLTGKGVLLGLIDSGIDYNLPIFKDEQGKSKILYYWDQSTNGTPPEGFTQGSLYTNEDINNAINGNMNIPISTTAMHGTHVGGIACSIANEAQIIAVRVGNRTTDVFSRSTEFMRALKFVLDRALELKMPIAINVSYGSNEGSHRGESLFEQYIDQMCGFWKNNIVVAAGNNAAKAGHKRINIKNDENSSTTVEVEVGQNESIININIWPSFIDDFTVTLISPSNRRTQSISKDSGQVKNIISNTRINGFFYPIEPYSLTRRISIELKSDTSIIPGIWQIEFTPIQIVEGNIDIYLPTSEGITKDTRFLEPTNELTVTVPGTASRVITVGSFNSRTDEVSIFSGRGDVDGGIIKPEILAPGEDIVSYLPGGITGALTGTSMATPHVTGTCALLLQWGIVEGNDLFLYDQKTKSMITTYARRRENDIYPNNASGYGFLDLSNLDLTSILNNNSNYGLYRKKIKRMKRQIENNLIPVANVLYDENFKNELDNLGINYRLYEITDNFGLLYLPINQLEKLNDILNLESGERIDPPLRLAQLGEVTQGTFGGVVGNEEIGANFFKNNPNINVTGRGVIIGIANSGIDYLHEDFIYADRTSKIIALWDQTKEGNPPSGYKIGTEYTREDINRAIRENDKSLSTDEEGIGTMLSGICCGLGNGDSRYQGVATDAELIIVKLAKLDGNYTSSLLYAAMGYIYNKALELNRPLIFNLGLGSNQQVAITSRTIGNKFFFLRGIMAIEGAGNEGNTQTHTSGVLSSIGDEKDIDLEIEEDEDEVTIQIWVNRPDKVDVQVISPSEEISKTSQASNYNVVYGLFDLDQTSYLIYSTYPTIESGQQLINISLINAKRGTWRIRLIGSYITNGIYNAYLENRAFLKPGTRFSQSNPSSTINYPGTYEDAITVGAYDTKNNTIWPSSSRGPLLDSSQKPDILAPGVDIIAPYPGNRYAMITGTSAASSYTAGAVALFLQYILVDNIYPEKAFVQNIATYLKTGATRVSNISYPNESYGYGILNIRGAFEQLR